jgi:hypothetical protein
MFNCWHQIYWTRFLDYGKLADAFSGEGVNGGKVVIAR